MRRSTLEQVCALQHAPERIRTICIVAHVDHGKTSLSDRLVATNGIISDRVAGKVRYLDHTPDEQVRGITMKSSAIALLYESDDGPGDDANATTTRRSFLVHLVDSPGHVDFSFDVGTAVRLCDGALVVIDVVEGVCAQTLAVLRQVYAEGIRPCLVLNKLDRLITEVQLSPLEAYHRLCRIVEETNAVLSALIRTDLMDQAATSDERGRKEDDDHDDVAQATEALETAWLFSPARGNVIFASATDGWAFSLGSFATTYAKKLALPVRTVRRALWGDFYYHTKRKQIVTKAPTASSAPLFCAWILDVLWTTYKTLARPVASEPDVARVRTLLRQLRLAKCVTDRELTHADRKVATQLVMRKWLPLAPTVFKMVTRVVPSPVVAQAQRARKLCGRAYAALAKSPVGHALETCATSDDAPLIVSICKVVSVQAQALSDYRDAGLEATDEVYVGIGRVYAGVLRAGAAVYVLAPTFTPRRTSCDPDTIVDSRHVSRIESGVLKPYLMMGREFHRLAHVPAGNIVGLVGLHEHVLKTATLASTLACCSLSSMPHQGKPIVRVAIEPTDPRDLDALETGLQRLYRSDPTVDVHVQETGEHVLAALGELHLERCLSELNDRFAKVPVQVSAPLVAFRETIGPGTVSTSQARSVWHELVRNDTTRDDEWSQVDEHEPHGACGTTADGTLTLKVSARPLPRHVATWLEENAPVVMSCPFEDRVALAHELRHVLASSDDAWFQSLPLDEIWSFGPGRTGPNLLINKIPGYHVSERVFPSRGATIMMVEPPATEKAAELLKLENSLVTGFQLASSAGPLCHEPMWGVAFVLEDVCFEDPTGPDDTDGQGRDKYGPLSGQVMSSMRTTCLVAFVKRPVRLVEAVYECIVQCPAEHLGKLYRVLSKRRGDVYAEELVDGTALFTVKAHVPVVESFGFATEVRTQTSGGASHPHLRFSHWRVMELDPFFQPQTEDEREAYGERVYQHNFVRRYMDAVRKRKGLAVDEKIVVHAEKQRTLKR
ncbi:hypothetical protein PsorP6_002937 [Peronosclerospora sorghi]|uniref:Uncharacterized protein n=1 Tax=Peronosclerospora sorghi TaxID=230839 RepID=A0ACC0VJE3_9STRA|nr:hypothetical protein PsorP6_002937 [Peronosclerospora sorghi]